MTCHDVRELFSALIDEALDASERRTVDAHLATCAECRRELERLRSTVALLHAVEPARTPAGFVDRVLAAARPTPWYRRLLSALFLPWPVKIPAEAAAIVLVAVGVVYLYRVTPELHQWDRMERMPPPAPTELRRQLEAPPPARPEKPRPAPSSPTTSEAPPASQRRLAREYMEKEGLKDDSSRDADVPAPRAKNRVEGKLEAAPASPTPQAESRADAQAAAKAQAAPLGAASFVPPDVSGRLAVSDRDAALRGLDAVVTRLGAVVDRRLVGSEGPIVELSVTREAYPELVRELARLGRWQPTREPAELPAQIRVVLRITS
ncbi:MAG: hypothetical protein DMD97_10975 [Candidatus Rokuibacteriota bacterium]|nr:MAG: hypothetical protein DMD97_10975 [Candidatus Rokubacteria bacterium]